MHKRGLSNIIATVLLIIMSLIATGAVWIFFQATAKKTIERTELGIKCLKVFVEPVSCSFKDKRDSWELNATVKLTEGNAEGVAAIVDMDNQETETELVIPAPPLYSVAIIGLSIDIDSNGETRIPKQLFATSIVQHEKNLPFKLWCEKSTKAISCNFNCEGITSCSNFRNKISCEKNYCGIGNCKWINNGCEQQQL